MVPPGMTITFFFNVKDTGKQHRLTFPTSRLTVRFPGSWLEIGQSISFFCITSLLLLWAAGICAAGEYLLTDAIAVKNKTAKKNI
jgi:phosphatidylinositol glycan class N